jgi:hypothetical protein
MNTKIKSTRSENDSTDFKIGDLVMLKPAADITGGDSSLIEAYNHKEWVGIITEITQRETKQLEIWGTCMVMWRGRKSVNEFLAHLELISETR